MTPTLPIVAFDVGMDVPRGWPSLNWTTWTPFTYPLNLSGSPAVSVPCGFTSTGLPIGFQLVGGQYADNFVLAAARAYQEAYPLVDRRPDLTRRAVPFAAAAESA